MTQMTSSLMPFFSLIRVSGEDRTTFLHNQLSNDINNLPIGQACLATYNTAKGRVIATLLVLKRENDLLLMAATDQITALLKKLQMYVMRSKVKLEAMPEWGVAASAPFTHFDLPSEPQFVLPTTHHNNQWSITLPDGSVIELSKTEHLPPYDASIVTNWQMYEINHGLAWICAATSETCVAQMLNMQLVGAVNFKKGCYPGQEIIARAQYRGQVKRGLVKLQATAPVKEGELIYCHDDEVGLIINQVSDLHANLVLAVIKHDAVAEPLHTESAELNLVTQFF